VAILLTRELSCRSRNGFAEPDFDQGDVEERALSPEQFAEQLYGTP
jgi:hypothetical protein